MRASEWLIAIILDVPDDAWDELMKESTETCGVKGCDCHKFRENLFLVLASLRHCYAIISVSGTKRTEGGGLKNG